MEEGLLLLVCAHGHFELAKKRLFTLTLSGEHGCYRIKNMTGWTKLRLFCVTCGHNAHYARCGHHYLLTSNPLTGTIVSRLSVPCTNIRAGESLRGHLLIFGFKEQLTLNLKVQGSIPVWVTENN